MKENKDKYWDEEKFILISYYNEYGMKVEKLEDANTALFKITQTRHGYDT